MTVLNPKLYFNPLTSRNVFLETDTEPHEVKEEYFIIFLETSCL